MILCSVDFEAAERAFDEVRKIDPFRLDEIEIYSNMLYVMGKKAKLGQMAHEYAQVNKNRAEVCCLIGESCGPMLPRFWPLMLTGNVADIYRKLLFCSRRAHQSHPVFPPVSVTQ
jgi:hypothetical protein